MDALDDDPDLADAFYALTPGRQRSCVILMSSANTSETCAARDRILAGKAANER